MRMWKSTDSYLSDLQESKTMGHLITPWCTDSGGTCTLSKEQSTVDSGRNPFPRTWMYWLYESAGPDLGKEPKML